MAFVPVDINAIRLDAPEKSLPSRGRTALEQGLGGATFNLADEVYNRLGALGAYGYQAFTDMPTESQDSRILGLNLGAVGRGINSLQDLTDEASRATNQRLAEQLEKRPALSIGSNLAGALLTGGAGVTTKGGSTIANSLRTGNVAARAGKAGLLGSASGGLAGFGSGSGLEDRLESGGSGAVVSGGIGAAIPVGGQLANKAIGGGNLLKKGFTARGAEALDDAINARRAVASDAYNKMRQVGAVFTPQKSIQIGDEIADAFSKDGIINPVLHDKSSALVKQFKEAADRGNMSVEALDQWRQLFGEVAGNFGDKVNARKAAILIKKIDDIVGNATASDLQSGSREAIDALNLGRSEYARSRRFETVADIIKKADGDANYLKRNLKSLYDNAKKTRGFDPKELAALKEASSLSTPEAVMKMLGKFGFDAGNSRIGSGVGAVAGGAVGAGLGGTGVGVAVPVVGTVARYGQKLAARGKAETLLNTIEGMPQKVGLPAINAPKGSAPAIGATGAIAGQPSQPSTGFVPVDINTIQLDAPQVQYEPLSLNTEVPTLNQRIAQAESGGDVNAKNPNSSASGLYQFTDPTWRSAVDKWGRKYGIKYKDKNNPQAQEAMMNALTQDNARILKNKGIEVSDANLYFAHFLGAPAASKAIGLLGKNAIAARSFPKAASANPTIFFDKEGNPRTVDQVYELITSKVV